MSKKIRKEKQDERRLMERDGRGKILGHFH